MCAYRDGTDSLSVASQGCRLTVYKCSGTPADCVKLAFHTVLDRKPDLVVGGINHGDNSSVNVHYSGTMGVVIEGCLKGVPSIGFSLCNHAPDADFEPAGEYIREIARKVLEKGLPPLTCLNVNFPDTKELKGVKICEQAKGQWTNEWENFAHRGDAHYYWLTGEFEESEKENEKSDHCACQRLCSGDPDHGGCNRLWSDGRIEDLVLTDCTGY
mgnify:FL=1